MLSQALAGPGIMHENLLLLLMSVAGLACPNREGTTNILKPHYAPSIPHLTGYGRRFGLLLCGAFQTRHKVSSDVAKGLF